MKPPNDRQPSDLPATRRRGPPPVTDRPVTWPRSRQSSTRSRRTDPVSPIEREMVAKLVLDQAQPITPVQERAMARMLRRSPEVVKELIPGARVTFATRAPRYVDIHLRATEKALASGTAAGLDTALRSSQWAIERIAQDDARVIDHRRRPRAAQGGY